MIEKQYEKDVTLRLSDGFFMYRKLFATIDVNRLPKGNIAQLNKNHNKKYIPHNVNGPSEENRTDTQSLTNLKDIIPNTKCFIGVPTPGRPIPSDVPTPISLGELQK